MSGNKKYHMPRVVSNMLSHMLIIYHESFRVLAEIFLNVDFLWNNVIFKFPDCHVTVASGSYLLCFPENKP